jgi:hypothetical protein
MWWQNTFDCFFTLKLFADYKAHVYIVTLSMPCRIFYIGRDGNRMITQMEMSEHDGQKPFFFPYTSQII